MQARATIPGKCVSSVRYPYPSPKRMYVLYAPCRNTRGKGIRLPHYPGCRYLFGLRPYVTLMVFWYHFMARYCFSCLFCHPKTRVISQDCCVTGAYDNNIYIARMYYTYCSYRNPMQYLGWVHVVRTPHSIRIVLGNTSCMSYMLRILRRTYVRVLELYLAHQFSTAVTEPASIKQSCQRSFSLSWAPTTKMRSVTVQ